MIKQRKNLKQSHKNNISIRLKKYYDKNIVSNKTRKKLSNAITGKHHTEETKEKIRNIQLGKTYEDKYGKKKAKEIRNKQSIAKKGITPKNWHLLIGKRKGKHHTEETKKKIKEARSKQIIPKFDTFIELKIQGLLQQLGIEYFKHFYIKEIEHKYRCDIFIPRMNIIIECDGDYFHANPKFFPTNKLNLRQIEQEERDKLRTKELQEKGFRVIRIWEHDIKRMDIVKFNKILNVRQRGVKLR